MDRSTWLKEQRRRNEAQEDAIYAPIYDELWGAIDPTHELYFGRFLERCRPHAEILDAPCGTGKYWPLILASGGTVLGIDQSQGMLNRAQQKFPDLSIEKLGLQEMGFREAFDGAACVDTLEMVAPEDWPLVLANFHRALRPGGLFYFTVETASEDEKAKAFEDGRRAGLPLVYGEWAYAGGYQGEWAQDGGYHFYPKLDQVRAWIQQTGFRLMDDGVGEEYQHYLVRKD